MQRDRLTAYYRAALAAGCGDIDRRSWFGKRINTWDNESGALSARIILLLPPNVYMQRLPECW